MSQESEHFVIKIYREKALDTFIRGLRVELPRLLAIKEPADLTSALHYCLKLENPTYRSNHELQRKRKTHSGTPHFSADEGLWPSTASSVPSTKSMRRPAIHCAKTIWV